MHQHQGIKILKATAFKHMHMNTKSIHHYGCSILPYNQEPSSTLPRDGHVAASIEHLRQQLSAKEEECREKDEVIRDKDESLKEKDSLIREKDEALMEKDEVIREKDEVIREKSATNQAQQAEIQRLSDQLAVSQKVS